MSKNIMKESMKVLIFMLMVLISVAFGQRMEKKTKVLKEVNNDGWNIIGIELFEKTNNVTTLEEYGNEIKQIVYKPKKKYSEFEEPLFDIKEKKIIKTRKYTNEIRYSVRRICSYEYQSKEFAYEVELVAISLTHYKNYTTKSYCSGLLSLFYLDKDGDGIFETFFGGKPTPLLPLRAYANVSLWLYPVVFGTVD